MWNFYLEEVLLIIVVTLETCIVMLQFMDFVECNHC
jgi:hypothetical protein